MAKTKPKVESETEVLNAADVDRLHYLMDRKGEITELEEALKVRFRLVYPSGGTLKGTEGRLVVVEEQERRELKKLSIVLELFKKFKDKEITAEQLAGCLTVNAEQTEKVTSKKFVEQHVAARKKVLAVKTDMEE